jgi:hypothetical protein
VGFVRDLLLFLHLLGMATLVGAFLVQLRTGLDGPLNKGWLHGAGLQLVTGVALQLLAPVTDQDYNDAKLGVKLVVLIVIGALAIFYTVRGPARRWVPFTLVGLTVVNVGLAVFWH